MHDEIEASDREIYTQQELEVRHWFCPDPTSLISL
jgi:hypothetical protein